VSTQPQQGVERGARGDDICLFTHRTCTHWAVWAACTHLRPGENPGDGSQRLDATLLGASCGAAANVQPAQLTARTHACSVDITTRASVQYTHAVKWLHALQLGHKVLKQQHTCQQAQLGS
jgi:hypothetical protein